MNTPSNQVDIYISLETKWERELVELRRIVRSIGLTEDFKWGSPCYTLDGANIVLLHVFKEYCAILFFKGALLKDEHGLLVQQTENVQAARQLRFVNIEEVLGAEDLITAYIRQAIEVEKAGLKYEFKKPTEFAVAPEFQTQLEDMPELKAAFEALTPGRQRAYLLHFAGAKQSTTRQARVEKAIPDILARKGLND